VLVLVLVPVPVLVLVPVLARRRALAALGSSDDPFVETYDGTCGGRFDAWTFLLQAS